MQFNNIAANATIALNRCKCKYVVYQDILTYCSLHSLGVTTILL